MTESEVRDWIYRISLEISDKVAEANRAHDDALAAIWAHYEPMIAQLAQSLPDDGYQMTEFSKRLREHPEAA